MKEFPLCVIWNDMPGMTKDTRALPFRSFKELYDGVEGSTFRRVTERFAVY